MIAECAVWTFREALSAPPIGVTKKKKYCSVEPVFGGHLGPQRIDRQTRRRDRKRGQEIVPSSTTH